MKYETPELTVLTPAINAIQGAKGRINGDSEALDTVAAYEDWED
jgi:hypothetical protein